MNYEFNKIYEEIFCFFLISTQWTKIYSAEKSNQIAGFQSNDKLMPRAELWENCWVKLCQENQFCNEEFVCQCRPGYKDYNNECIPFSVSGENEVCKKQEDCYGKLVCINGICRNPVSTTEFVTLAKICLGITVTTIIIAVFSSLYKYLIRSHNFQSSQRQSDTSSLNSTSTIRRRTTYSTSPLNVVQEEKPPSYEECVRSIEKNPSAQTPPYIISANPLTMTSENHSLAQPINLSVVNSPNLTPLNVQILNHEINMSARMTKFRSFENNPTTEK